MELPLHSPAAAAGEALTQGHNKITGMMGKKLFMLLFIVSLIGNLYVWGLLQHSPGSYTQLKNGGTAAYPGLITKASDKSISIKVTTKDAKSEKDVVSTKTVSIPKDTPYALFPKNYQTLIPIGLPSSNADIVIGTSEASVSAQLPYLASAKALRINIVRDDMLTGKVIEVKDGTIKFKAYAAAGYKDQALKVAANATFKKLGTDGALTDLKLADIKADQGLYAYLDKVAGPDDAVITKGVVADFTSSTSAVTPTPAQ